MSKNLFPIRYVSRQTGLTPHVIRAWEKRYNAVTPKRTETNRRLYSDEDIEKLMWLDRAVSAGNAIGQIASLTIEALQHIVAAGNNTLPYPEDEHSSTRNIPLPINHCNTCIAAIREFDAEALEHALTRAAIELNRMTLLEGVVVPVAQQIGVLWSEGILKIYHEHMAASILRTFLGDMLRFSDIQPAAPNIVVATPTGQHHELGALTVAVAAASDGWRVTYLGVNLPSEEIAGAADQIRAKAVCLSLVFPGDDPKLIFEIKKLRRYLPKQTKLFIGGQAAVACGKHLKSQEAILIQNLSDLLKSLQSIR